MSFSQSSSELCSNPRILYLRQLQTAPRQPPVPASPRRPAHYSSPGQCPAKSASRLRGKSWEGLAATKAEMDREERGLEAESLMGRHVEQCEIVFLMR
jgi:hypothetical protein